MEQVDDVRIPQWFVEEPRLCALRELLMSACGLCGVRSLTQKSPTEGARRMTSEDARVPPCLGRTLDSSSDTSALCHCQRTCERTGISTFLGVRLTFSGKRWREVTRVTGRLRVTGGTRATCSSLEHPDPRNEHMIPPVLPAGGTGS